MNSRFFRFFVGLAIFICSTPFGMAQEVIREEVRADFFAAADLDGEDDRLGAVSFGDAGLVQFAQIEYDGESSADGEEISKREQKRALSHKIYFSKCRVLKFLSAKSQSKGVARHPASQDAGQERTAAIRFLHQKSFLVA